MGGTLRKGGRCDGWEERCKECRIAERQKKCSLIKRLGEPGREADGTCRGFGTENDDEPIEQCKRCIACVDFDWEEEKARFKF